MNNSQLAHGVINRTGSTVKRDYLFRVSVKAVVLNNDGHVLIVREHGHDWWDLPGGGVDHGETIEQALTRELKEEISYKGQFSFEPLLVEDPRYSKNHNVYQIRITYLVKLENINVEAGEDCNELRFINPDEFRNSTVFNEQKIFEYSQLAKSR